MKKQKGITLIVLVVTIIVLLIIAGATIAILTGDSGILKKGEESANKTDKQTATEIMNLKITNAQMQCYAETQKMPNLQYLADRLCEDLDKDIEYVRLKEKEVATIERIKISSEEDTILTKLKEYSYEFEIDSELKLASVDGIKVADKNTEKIEQLENEIKELKKMCQNLKSEPAQPVGTVISYMGNNAPDGYLACNGQTYNISEYTSLAEQIKKEFGRYNYYGGNGTTTFATPNLIGKFLKGSNTAGVGEEAGLPNITGSHTAYSWGDRFYWGRFHPERYQEEINSLIIQAKTGII